ncbi:MAG: hypothetical protein MUE97_00845 [Phycisphaerales bacterium]|jgi:hypothetical protein|nr:hypothetical protein [Phycisphaerales bacterium]
MNALYASGWLFAIGSLTNIALSQSSALVNPTQVPSVLAARLVLFADTPTDAAGNVTAPTVHLMLQMRALRPIGMPNFGAFRGSPSFGNGNTRTPSSIAVTGPAWIARGPANDAQTLFGRALDMRYESFATPNHPTDNIPQNHGDGRWTPTAIRGMNPIANFIFPDDQGPVATTDGQWSPWRDMYAVTIHNTGPGIVQVQAFTNAGAGIADFPFGGMRYIVLDGVLQPVTATATITFGAGLTPVPVPIPTPASTLAVSMMCLISARRRR